jgi:hypothetical protein
MDVNYIILLTVVVVILLGGIIWVYNISRSNRSSSDQYGSDSVNIREIMANDSHLHRLLMIEIISDKSSRGHIKSSPTDENLSDNLDLNLESEILTRNKNLSYINDFKANISSEEVTFNKMSAGISLLGKALVSSFGMTIAQRISTLMQKRNEIIRDYYQTVKNTICHNGNCIIKMITQKNGDEPVSSEDMFLDEFHARNINDSEDKTETVLKSAFPRLLGDNILGPHVVDQHAILSEKKIHNKSSNNITTRTHKKIEAITREITDTVAASFQIRDVDQTSKHPLIHYQRLFNLLTMYDKELINQAKSYTEHYYDISMNCAQSSLELTHHISDEFVILMKESQNKTKTSP